MKYTCFQIKNFKGIIETSINLISLPNGRIFPLVGLNESGKTTVLEAINFFQKDLEVGQEYTLIHKKESGNFTGDIEVKAILDLDKTDKEFIKETLKSKLFFLESDISSIEINKKCSYRNSAFDKSEMFWKFIPDLKVKTTRQKNFERLFIKNNQLWVDLVVSLKKNIPKILYFPNFLFDFPERIYLENIETLQVSDKDKEIQKEYRQIIDDILHCVKKTYNVTDFLTKLKTSDSQSQSAAAQIKQEISSILNRKIVTPWQQIFPGPNKNILIEIGNDNFGYYLQIKVNEGTSSFLVNERSLGFRWFFGFILFTEFRKERDGENGEYIFLFDEPASNLHERSQQKLLDLFENLTNNSKIIYSTHSPYLINKKYILNAFIVKDEGRSLEEQWEFKQNIKAIPYRKFVADYPNQETHFKPILDVLEFVDNPFTPNGNIVFFEGKFDYYTFKLIEKRFFINEKYKFNFYPGGGVEKYENIFRECLCNNRKFISVFDSDKAGNDAKNDYLKNISQELEKHVFNLKEIDLSFDKFTTENIFTDEEKIRIQKLSFPASTIYKKSEFNTVIQELFINENDFELSDETKSRFKKIFDFIKQKFNELNN